MASKEEFYDAGLDLAFDENYAGAIEQYKAALEIDPGYVDALHALAMAHAEQGQLDEAIAIGKQLCAVSPDDILAHTSLSTFYMRKDMVPEAEAESAKARMLDWKRQLKEPKEGSG